jgi:TatA/E family protein of Tat protein translocase
MLAFIDSPVQLVVVAVVVLLVFGPQKLPEMLNQLGRAIREFKKTTSELSNSLNADDRYEPHYNPPRYDSYGNPTESAALPSVPEEDVRQLSAATAPASEPQHGDFAASAFADTSSEYGTMPTPTATHGTQATEAAVAESEVVIRPAEGSVSRNAG